MSNNPFSANSSRAAEFQRLETRVGKDVRADAGHRLDRNTHILRHSDVIELCQVHNVPNEEALLVLLPPLAADLLSRPSISNFYVGAVGRDKLSGDLILGGNAEIFGAHLGFTLHGEGFVAIRAFQIGATLDQIATGEAHPCGHCRQFLSEFSYAPDLRLIDSLGHSLALSDLYPWPFDPAYLGETGAIGGQIYWPDLNWTGEEGMLELLNAGRVSYAPYSKSPSAIAMIFNDGTKLVAGTIESVAFNPTISPGQSALVAAMAGGRNLENITEVVLGTTPSGAVHYGDSTRQIFSKLAPSAKVSILEWQVT